MGESKSNGAIDSVMKGDGRIVTEQTTKKRKQCSSIMSRLRRYSCRTVQQQSPGHSVSSELI